ncbi:hypothetical protein LCGC14_3153680, partial [marine sediment metagenome]
ENSRRLATNPHSVPIEKMLEQLTQFKDASDPDLVNLPNWYHLYQTAEGIRRAGLPRGFQAVGLIHDLGKVMYLWGNDKDGTSLEQQWGIAGDTFLVGCRLPEECIYPEFNNLNPDMQDPVFSQPQGIYPPRCGLDQCLCAWGHDEYLYQVLAWNRQKHQLSELALSVIRYHSLYPWHQDECYREMMTEKDYETLKWVKIFNRYDLYTKDPSQTDFDVQYYQELLDEFFPVPLVW